MKIIIITSNKHKQIELSRYFENIGLKTKHLNSRADLNVKEHEHFICVTEQTQLLNKNTLVPSSHSRFEEVIHTSTVTLEIRKDSLHTKKEFTANIEGFVFPNKKTNRADVYNWDDVFVSSKTMKTYQDMKDRGLKNSARDVAFSKAVEHIQDVFQFENKINLNFNPSENDNVISFDPFIKKLFDENEIYKKAYQNRLFKNLITNILNSGTFIRRASDRKERNYWLPGLNAGIPLTPKKDEFHELTFMFHDIMHFIYPDVLIVDDTENSKNKYIISRMMSEAFTLVLADMLFVDLLKNSGLDYDYSKRKIHPIFEKCKFEINPDNIEQLERLLWANTCFALLGSDKELFALTNDQAVVNDYKNKYQRFFQEDYRWTSMNYESIVKNSKSTQQLSAFIDHNFKGLVDSTHTFAPNFDSTSTYKNQVRQIFDIMFKKLSSFILVDSHYNEDIAYSNAIRRYYCGQIALFFRFENLYNHLFLEQIVSLLKKETITSHDLASLNELYATYVEKLKEDHFISEYLAKNYKNIFPIFDPKYVFYEKKESENFKETVNQIFNQEYLNV